MIRVSCLILAATMAAAGAARAADAEGRLVHRFAVGERDDWNTVVIDPASADWRLGSEDGPPASAAQVRAGLAAIDAIEVGSVCKSWIAGAVTYPCGFAMRGVEWGRVIASHPQMSANDVAAMRRDPGTEVALAKAAQGLPHFSAPRFVALWVLQPKAVAADAPLRFEFCRLPNSIAPSDFERGGLITLHIGKRGTGV